MEDSKSGSESQGSNEGASRFYLLARGNDPVDGSVLFAQRLSAAFVADCVTMLHAAAAVAAKRDRPVRVQGSAMHGLAMCGPVESDEADRVAAARQAFEDLEKVFEKEAAEQSGSD